MRQSLSIKSNERATDKIAELLPQRNMTANATVNETMDGCDDCEVVNNEPYMMDYAEMVICIVFVLIGAPLNVSCLMKTTVKYMRHYSRSTGFLLMRMNLLVADVLVLCGYGLSQAIWLGTYWVSGEVCSAWLVTILTFPLQPQFH